MEGELNVSYNCVDRHAFKRPDDIALIHEPDDPREPSQKITFKELLQKVSQVANTLHEFGLRKGDSVGIYMSMCPELAIVRNWI
jgi:acetyl-CoA synthetase